MRILIISQYFWPENFRVNDLASALVQRGHSVTVLTGLPNYPEGRIFSAFRTDRAAFDRFEGASIVRVPLVPRGSGRISLALNYLSFAVTGSILGAWMLRRRKFDAIFVFQTSPITAALPAVLLKRLKNSPLLMWVLDLWPDTLDAIGIVRSPRLLRLVGQLVRFIYRHCDRILIQSRGFEKRIANYCSNQAAIRYFPGWAEDALTRAGGGGIHAKELSPYGDDFIVLFAGNIGEAQDFPTIIEAADLLRNNPGLRWVILGDGRAAPAQKREVARRGLCEHVQFLGRFPLDRMPEFFQRADALLVSLRDDPVWAMTIPGKVQSYLSAGRPILAAINGEGAKIVQEAGAGLVSPASNAAELASNVEKMMAMDPIERSAMGHRGCAYSEREFDRRRLIDLLVDEFATANEELRARRTIRSRPRGS